MNRFTSKDVLALDPHSHLHRGPAHPVDGGPERDYIAQIHGLDEAHLVDRSGDDRPPGMLDRGDPSGGVDEFHDHTSMDGPRQVGVRDAHRLGQLNL
jgi:hypothetical protein